MPIPLIAAGALMAAGAGAQAGGGLIGAAQERRAGRQARDFSNVQTGQGMDRLGGLLYGDDWTNYRLPQFATGQGTPGHWDNSMVGPQDPYAQGKWVPGTYGAVNELDPSVQNLRLSAELARSQGGGILQQYRQLAGQAQQGGQDILGASERGGQGLMAQYAAQTQGLQRRLGSGRAGIDALGAGAEAMGANYGRGANALIDENAARQLTGANRMAAGSLAARGFGASTAVANQQSANAQDIGRSVREQKVDVLKGQTDRMMAARGARMGTAERMAGMDSALGERRAAGAADIGSSNLNRNLGLMDSNLSRYLALSGKVPDTMLGVGQGAVMNPWLGQGTSAYYPQTSGGGAALSNVGGGLAALGSYGLGQNQQMGLMSQYAQLMQNQMTGRQRYDTVQ